MDNWISPAQAIEALARLHEKSGRFADYDVCVSVAEDTLLERLAWGQIATLADHVEQGTIHTPSEVLRDTNVPLDFWGMWLAREPVAKRVDWVAGDFRYESPNAQTPWWGAAFGVRVRADQIPGYAAAEEREKPAITNASQRRPPANWWPDFAEELAIYVLEEGLPGGQGAEGQSEVIDEIFRRMAEAGKAEPGRTTVQPVVSAVLRRWRLAGNS